MMSGPLSSHTNDVGSLVEYHKKEWCSSGHTLSGVWRYRLSTKAGWPAVYELWLGEKRV